MNEERSTEDGGDVSWAHSSPALLRAHHARDARERTGELPEDVVETVLPSEGAFRGGLLFTPADCAREDTFVYFHGGGFVAGSPETHRCVTAWLAKLSGMRVLSARYRLAPENPFPAQREDAVAACVRALALAGEAGLVLAGDSAGSCVALWGLRALEARMRSRVRGLVLLYGGYGLTDSPSIARYGTPENGLDSETLAVMYRRLRASVIAWPLDFAREIAEPAYVLAAERDAVFDDSLQLFRSLAPSQGTRDFVVAQAQDHGFLKATGKDAVAMRELEKAARWAAQLAGGK